MSALSSIALSSSAALDAQATRKSEQMLSLRGSRKVDPAQAEKIARDFEATFIHQMLQHMFSGITPNAMFGGGKGEEMFQSVLLDEYAKNIAAAGGVGVAAHVKNTLLGLQEVTRS